MPCRFNQLRRLTAMVLLAVLAPVAVIAGQKKDSAAAARQAADTREQVLMDLALGAEGELAADLVLRLVENGHIRSDARRRQIGELVLARLSSANEPYPLDFIPGYGFGNREGDRYSGITIYPVDALSLRCRVVRQMIAEQPEAARFALFELDPDLGLPKVACSQIVLPKVEIFYQTLGEVVAHCFTTEERKDGAHWETVSRYLAGITSPVQIGPACKLIMTVGAPPAVRERFVSDIAGAIGKLEPSPRALFLLTMWSAARIDAMPEVLTAVKDSPDTHRALRDAFRKFVTASLGMPRCGDLAQDAVPEFLEQLNSDTFAGKPILADELTSPVRTKGAAAHVFWVSPESKRMLLAFQNLNTARRSMEPGTDMTEWRAEYLRVLGQFRDWTAVSERSDYDYVSQKGQLMAGMVENAYDDATRTEAIRDFLAMMRHANAAQIPGHVMLLSTVIMFERSTPATRTAMLEGLRSSGTRSLSVYAALQLEGVDALRIEAPKAP